jgi:Family of unknown function (DUF6521)
MTDDMGIDVYAHTNPAFWAFALSKFIVEYTAAGTSGKREPCPYPLLFLPMPLSFANDARRRFDGTNKTTGLMTWLERNPSVRATVAAEIMAARPYSRRALTFALAHDLISTDDGWGYLPGDRKGWKKPAWPVKSDQRGVILQACGRLGQWCAMVEVATVFIALGVRP